jgi:hypothetical protein
MLVVQPMEGLQQMLSMLGCFLSKQLWSSSMFVASRIVDFAYAAMGAFVLFRVVHQCALHM